MCVCFPKVSEAKPIFGGIVQQVFFKRQSITRKWFCSSGRFLVKLHCHANHFKTTMQAESSGRLPAVPSLIPEARAWSFDWVLQSHYSNSEPDLGPRGISSFSEKQTGTHLFNISVMSWWQWDPTVEQGLSVLHLAICASIK